MNANKAVSDSEVGMTRKAHRKTNRFYEEDEARARVRALWGDLYLHHGEDSHHDDPEFHLHDPKSDYTIIFVAADDKPIIITQCHRHWEYRNDDSFTFIGGNV